MSTILAALRERDGRRDAGERESRSHGGRTRPGCRWRWPASRGRRRPASRSARSCIRLRRKSPPPSARSPSRRPIVVQQPVRPAPPRPPRRRGTAAGTRVERWKPHALRAAASPVDVAAATTATHLPAPTAPTLAGRRPGHRRPSRSLRLESIALREAPSERTADARDRRRPVREPAPGRIRERGRGAADPSRGRLRPPRLGRLRAGVRSWPDLPDGPARREPWSSSRLCQLLESDAGLPDASDGKLEEGAEVRHRMALRGGPARGGARLSERTAKSTSSRARIALDRNAPISLRVHG